MADNKLTILYSRLSCEDENKTGESLSIENQKKLLEDYAISANLTNIVHIVDDGISGTTFNREGMNRAVEEIDKGNVSNFVCKDAYVKLRITFLEKFYKYDKNTTKISYVFVQFAQKCIT
jgi:DNA invertase Pin-like site-specific DNA recombinase